MRLSIFVSFWICLMGCNLAVAETGMLCKNLPDRKSCADCCVAMSRNEAKLEVFSYCKKEQFEDGLPFYFEEKKSGISVSLSAKAMEQACGDYSNIKNKKVPSESIDDCLKICRSKPSKHK